MHKIQNNFITLTTCTKGAEMTSIMFNNKEYLWNADAKYWNRHSPVLFPIVGMLKNGKTIINEKEYKMGRHGFARDMEFELIATSDNLVTYLLKSNEDTKEFYPFDFELYVTYELNENTITTTYEVVNTNNTDMFFSIGAHPAFNIWDNEVPCPSYEGIYIEFEENETIDRLNIENGILLNKGILALNNEKVIKLNDETFKEDALVFKNLASNKVWLKNEKSDKKVAVEFDGFPYLGIWGPIKPSPFVCIEPWCGVTDTENATGEFKDKEGIIKLAADDTFKCSYTIHIL